jgi:GntR family transcriptional repressor for pyruvate dehydrogenase complex
MVAPLDLSEAREQFQARALIEIACVRLAAEQAAASEIAAIRTTLQDGEAAIVQNDAAALAAMDEAFHVAVARASHNKTLARMVMTLHHQTARFWLAILAAPSLEESRAALAQHHAVVDAVAARDPDRAADAMRASLGDFPDLPQGALQ